MPDDNTLFEIQMENAEMLLAKAKESARYGDRYVAESSNPVKGAAKGVLHGLMKGPAKFLDKSNAYYREYEKTVSEYSSLPTQRVAKFFEVPRSEKNRRRRVWKRSYFDTTEYLPFEMLTIPVPGGYLGILEQFYGDWKTPVRGKATHGGMIFDASRSYLEYFSSKDTH